MLLTDLITPKHLEFLGDALKFIDGCDDKRLGRERDHFFLDFRFRHSMGGDWKRDRVISNHEASCILEHASKVKLDAQDIEIHGNKKSCGNEKMVWHREKARYLRHDGKFTAAAMYDDALYMDEPTALVAAIDSLIEGERDEA